MPTPAKGNQQHSEFAHLHVHSEYSLTDGAIRIKKLIAKVKEFGHTSVAVTDHSNLFGAIEFYTTAKAEGINPIIGAELYCELSPHTKKLFESSFPSEKPPRCFHAVHLAQTNQGYKNLVKLVSAGYLSDLCKDVPIVPYDKLLSLSGEQFHISCFHSGELSYLTTLIRKHNGDGPLQLDHPKVQPIIQTMRKITSDIKEQLNDQSLFVELCKNNLPSDDIKLIDVATIANHLDLPLVATANAHYLNAEDKEAHLVVLGIKNDLKLKNLRNRRKNIQAHLFTPEEIQSLYSKWPEAIKNTGMIARRCFLDFKFGEYYLPKITSENGQTTEQSLRILAKEGLESRFVTLKQLYGPEFDEKKQEVYWKRLEYEMSVIVKMGFPDYFLIVQDFINWAKEQDIPVGPGRGSGAGSLVAYALKITDLDPLPYNLIFERFLNPERVSMPDFDIDFCQERRDEVIRYVTDRYGKENVAQITTFGKMLAKAVVRDVGRVLDVGYGKVDRIAKLIPNELGIKLQAAIDIEPRLKEQADNDPLIKDLLDIALQLEGLSRHTSVHAAGLVISDGAMENYVPVYRTDDGSLITQFEMKNAEKVGLVKFDFLGLKTLTVIKKTIDLIKSTTGQDLNIETIDLTDSKVYSLISSAQSVGVFQLESTGMQQLLLKLKPNTFEDVIALVALFRPGPLGSGMVDDFVERKHGRQEIDYPLPQLEPVLKDTYGTILYQEQVQKIASVLANYSLGEADLLRRAMGKKKPEEMAKQKSRFVSGCKNNNIEEAIATNIFDLMAKFAEYGFNKSHSAAYGLISYQTAYLKTHYTAQFLAASMTCDMDNTEKIVRYTKDCKNFKVKLLPPSLNHSELSFSVPEPNKIRFGLSAIKGIGEGSVKILVSERDQNGPYRDFTNLAKRVNLHKVGKKTLELLIQAGAFDEFGAKRANMMTIVAELVKYSQNHHEAESKGQQTLFQDLDDSDDTLDQFADIDLRPAILENTQTLEKANQWLKFEKKVLGVYLSSHPMKLYTHDVNKYANAEISELPKLVGQSNIYVIGILVDYFERTTREGKKMLILRIEDEKDQVSPSLFEGNYDTTLLPELESPVICKFKVHRGFEDNPPRVRLEEISALEDYRGSKDLKLKFKIKTRQGASADTRNIQTNILAKLGSILEQSPGNTEMKLVLEFGNEARVTVNSKKLRLNFNNDTLHQLSKLKSDFNCETELEIR